MRTNSVRTEMRCNQAKRVSRHAECVTRRRVLREPSQHAIRMTGYLQSVMTNDEADRQLEYGAIRIRQIHLLLDTPPRFWAAFFMSEKSLLGMKNAK